MRRLAMWCLDPRTILVDWLLVLLIIAVKLSGGFG
jgi:hypothetical protein